MVTLRTFEARPGDVTKSRLLETFTWILATGLRPLMEVQSSERELTIVVNSRSRARAQLKTNAPPPIDSRRDRDAPLTERVFVNENPSTHDQGTDRPGREFASAHSTIRSAVEPTDWHDIEEHRFAERASEALERGGGHRRGPAAHARRLAQRAPPGREGAYRARDQQGFHQSAGVGNRAACRRLAGDRLSRGPRRSRAEGGPQASISLKRYARRSPRLASVGGAPADAAPRGVRGGGRA